VHIVIGEKVEKKKRKKEKLLLVLQ